MSEIDWDAGYAGFADRVATLAPLADFVEQQAKLWLEIVQALPDGGRALLVGHGGACAFLNGTAVFCLPQADHRKWGPVSGYCEGVRLSFEGGQFTAAEILRVEQGRFTTE